MRYFDLLPAKTKRDIIRIIPFGIIWFVFTVVYLVIEKGLLNDLEYYPSTGNEYEFGVTSLLTLFTATLSGLVIGTLEIKFLDKLFSDHNFGRKILYKTSIYILIMVGFLILLSLARYSIQLQTHVFDERVWSNLSQFLSSYFFWGIELYIAMIIGGTLFFSEVSENIGSFVLQNFLLGRYHKPIIEDRIFMFLDMNSSTSIAEKIGHVKYFEMLRKYYADLTEPIIEYSGEIYQYVGDEIVVSWKPNSDQNNDNCIKCFFAMKDSLKNQSEKYISDFGVVPEFKAGIHYGRVTTGEIGVIKKDIIFTGDVLNTTSRILGLCTTYNVDLLISEELKNILLSDTEIQIQSLGKNQLRGRNEELEIFSILKH